MSCHCLFGKSSPPLKSFQGSFFDGCKLVFNMDLVRAPTKKRKAENQRKRETRGVRICGKFRTRNQAKTKLRGRRMVERSKGRFFRAGSPATAMQLPQFPPRTASRISENVFTINRNPSARKKGTVTFSRNRGTWKTSSAFVTGLMTPARELRRSSRATADFLRRAGSLNKIP